MSEIRSRHGYQRTDLFKWDTHSRPGQVDRLRHLAAKEEALALLAEQNLVFLPVLVHHHVAETKSKQTLVEWNANMAMRLWDNSLQTQDQDGVCILDRRPAGEEGAYLRGLFSRAPEETQGQDFSLKRTFLLGYTMDGASHLLSVLDIALGAFCYAINERREERTRTAAKLLKTVVSAMWTLPTTDGALKFAPGAYAFLPVRKKSPKVQADYDELVRHWNRLMTH
ncbi:MAG: hypothetical protein WCB19_06865 [Thermoplasmata archaeon]